jgi:hypothetical protein
VQPGYVCQEGLGANEGTTDSIVEAYYDAVEPITSDPKIQKPGEDAMAAGAQPAGQWAAATRCRWTPTPQTWATCV